MQLWFGGFVVPPAVLAPLAFGVDISSGSVKCASFVRRGAGLAAGAYAEVPLPDGAFQSGELEKPDAVTEVVRSLRLKHRMRVAHASLSEKKAFLYQVIAPPQQQSLREAVEFDLEAHVPLPPAEIVFDFEVVRRSSQGTVLAVTAYARRIIEQYLDTFARAGVELRSLEIESHALARAVVPTTDRDRVVMVVDMGRATTRIAVVDHGVVSYTATLELGGDSLTAALMKKFSIDEAAAEQLKNERGFLMGKDNADVVEAVIGSVSVIRDELVRHLEYWNRPQNDAVPRSLIEKIIVSGGNVNMRGLPEYLSDALQIPVVPGAVWHKAFSLNEYVPAMPYNESLEYAPAIGLALKSVLYES